MDAAARKVIADFGFGPDYKVPGLPHRTGHGIGLDVHEWTYLVRRNKMRLPPGMCFSDEPMIGHLRRVRRAIGKLHVHHRRRRAHVYKAESRHRSAIRVRRRTYATSHRSFKSALPDGNCEGSGSDERVWVVGDRAGAWAGDAVPDRSPLGPQRTFVFAGCATERRAGVRVAWLEEIRAKELIYAGEDIRVWQEDESPFQKVVEVLKNRGVPPGRVGIDDSARFFVFDGIRKLAPKFEYVSGQPVLKAAA